MAESPPPGGPGAEDGYTAYSYLTAGEEVGIDHVAFGPDTLYGDHVALHRVFTHLLAIGATQGPSFEPVAYVDGLENPTENFPNICGWLVQHGFDDAEIQAVLGGNVYRTLQSIWIG